MSHHASGHQFQDFWQLAIPFETDLEILTWNVHLWRGHRRHARVDVVGHLKQHRHPAAARDVDRAGELAAGHDLQRARQLDLVVVIVASDVVENRALDHRRDGEDVHAQVHRVHG